MRIPRGRRRHWLARVVLGWAVAGALALAGTPARASDKLSTEDRAALQSVMSQYIDQHMIGDAFIHFDPRSGVLQKLYPATQHPMIVSMKGVVVLCADLRTAEGTLVNVDFYATKDSDRYVIFQAEIGNREPLQALLMRGIASLLE